MQTGLFIKIHIRHPSESQNSKHLVKKSYPSDPLKCPTRFDFPFLNAPRVTRQTNH